MVKIIKKISLEVCKPNLFKVIVAKQFDSKSRFLKVTFVDDSKKIEVPKTAEVIINATRSDGERNSFAGECNADGTATVPLASWMLELSGVVTADVSVIDAEGRKLTTSAFVIEVEEAACDNGDISEDENYDVLIKLIKDVKELQFVTDETLTLKDGVLSVNTTNEVAKDNTLPITSAAVAVTVGNIEVLLETI